MQTAKKLRVEIFTTQHNILDAKCQLINHNTTLVSYRNQLTEALKPEYTSVTEPVHRFLGLKSKSVADFARERASSLHKQIFDAESKVEDHHFYILRLEAKLQRLLAYKTDLEKTAPSDDLNMQSVEDVGSDQKVVQRSFRVLSRASSIAHEVMNPTIGGKTFSVGGKNFRY